MPTLTQKEIDSLRELYEQTTRGEWDAHGNGIHRGTGAVAITSGENHEIRAANARFIAAAHNAFPSLLATLEEKDAMLKRWKSAIEGLTPNGSEYVDDPEACAAAIRRRTRWPQQIIALRTELQQKEAEIEQVKEGYRASALEFEKATIAALDSVAAELQRANERVVKLEAGLRDHANQVHGSCHIDVFQKCQKHGCKAARELLEQPR